MEEPKDGPSPAPSTPTPPRRPVMDIQAPRPSAAPSQPSVPVTESPAPTPTPAPVEAPQSVEPQKPGLSPELLAEAQKATGTAPDDKSNDPHHKLLAAHAQKHHAPRLAIALAIIIAIALAGLTVFAYMQTQNKTHTNGDDGHSQNESTTQQTTPAATESNVDDASKSVDEAINAGDESKDIPESGLSNQSLGL